MIGETGPSPGNFVELNTFSKRAYKQNSSAPPPRKWKGVTFSILQFLDFSCHLLINQMLPLCEISTL